MPGPDSETDRERGHRKPETCNAQRDRRRKSRSENRRDKERSPPPSERPNQSNQIRPNGDLPRSDNPDPPAGADNGRHT